MYSSLYYSIAPNVCCLCDGRGSDGLDLCDPCCASLPRNPHCCYQCALPLAAVSQTQFSPLVPQYCGRCLTLGSQVDNAIIPFLYRPPLDYMIKKLKFSERMQFSRTLGELLAGAIEQAERGLPDLIVPVPVHKQRLVRRGYNQAELIARTVANRLKVTQLKSVVERSQHKLSQSSLSARDRETNIRRAFTVTDREKISGFDIAVVDDVYTTGATARAMAAQLRSAGASRVSVWAVARTP